MAFHSFDSHLVITNESDSVRSVYMYHLDVGRIAHLAAFSVYDWLHRRRLCQFFNGNPRGTSITSLHFINEDVGGLILTGAGTCDIRFDKVFVAENTL